MKQFSFSDLEDGESEAKEHIHPINQEYIPNPKQCLQRISFLAGRV